MKFEPKPVNDFRDFYGAYFQRCQAQCPKIAVIAAKWRFEDLVPGLSDFDTRFIVNDDVTLDEWHQYSLRVGQVHTKLAVEVPRWARNLEHLPGLNLTGSEVASPLQYYPEFKQWTFYSGDVELIRRIERGLGHRAWSQRDEIYHLKKIAIYFGPYMRGIDPPINIGPWENKYPLHSRYTHYFSPPVQAMVSLKLKRTIRGKFEALRLAGELFPNSATIDRIFDTIDAHYEIKADYAEPRLTQIERELEQYLAEAWATLADDITLIEVDPVDTRKAIRDKVNAVPVDPAEAFFEGIKFARFMKGRLLFYATEVAWFDTVFLIHNELGRIVTNFYDKPLRTFGQLYFGQDLEPKQVLERLRGDVLTGDDCDGMTRFAQIAGQPIRAGHEKQHARAVADAHEPILSSLEKLSTKLIALQEES